MKKYSVEKVVYQAVERVPVLLPVALAIFGAWAMLLLVLGHLGDLYTWPIGLLLASMGCWYVSTHFDNERIGSVKARKFFDYAAIVFVILWTCWNVMYTSQNVFVRRDPAIYTVAAAWLKNHNQLQIPIGSILTPRGGNAKITSSSAGFDISRKNQKELFTQGQHLLPVLLGLSSRLFGLNVMLKVNVLIGAVALLALYSLGRLIARPGWALFSVIILGISLPLLYTARDTFTEPLTMTFVFGGLTLLWYAQKKNNRCLWFVSGLVLGASAMVRIDAYIIFAALVGFCGIYFAAAQEKHKRLQRFINIGAFLVGMVIPSTIGWLDVTILASGYYTALSSKFKLELALLITALLLGFIGALVIWKTKLLNKMNDKLIIRAKYLVLALLVLVSLALVARPLWLVSHHSKNIPLVGSLQSAAGDRQDPTRDYAENTITWLAWYMGPLMVIAAGIGLGILTAKSFDRKTLKYIPLILVVVLPTILYLNKPSITPDQVWAARRFMPVTFPGLAILGAVCLDTLDGRLRRRSDFVRVSTLSVLGLLIVLPILYISRPFLRVRSYTPELSQVNQVCKSLPEKSVVLWVGQLKSTATQTARAFCGVEAAGVGSIADVNLAQLANRVDKADHSLIIGYEKNEDLVADLKPVSKVHYLSYPSVLYHPPRNMVSSERIIYLGLVKLDGTIVPIGQN